MNGDGIVQEEKIEQTKEETFVKGTHMLTIFHNDDNLYSVVKIRVQETNLEALAEGSITITGFFPILDDEAVYTFYGTINNHPRFGMQFDVKKFKKEIPESKEGIVTFLSGPMFKGIGKKTAKAIVKELGANAIREIIDNPNALDGIPKLDAKKIESLRTKLMEYQGMEDTLVWLAAHQIGPQLSMRIFQVYKENTIALLQNNPYRMMEDVDGLGFMKSDELARELGFESNHPYRIRAVILHILDQICLTEGHTYLETRQLLEQAGKMLEKGDGSPADYEEISKQLLLLEADRKIRGQSDWVTLTTLYYAEKGIANHLMRLLEHRENLEQFSQTDCLLALGKIEETAGIQYADAQIEAIFQALREPVLILTGGPGTGKTTVINGIVQLFSDLYSWSLNKEDYKDNEPFPLVLAAPTGRAAKRMTETTGLPAATIHRLLGWNGTDGFQHDEDNQLAGKLFIIDESSMVDTWLMFQLLRSIPNGAQIIFVGDEDQLPSVGPGQVLKDLLDSGKIPTAKLKTIFRQAEGSSIIELAHAIKNGGLPKDLRMPKSDRNFFPCQADQVLDIVQQVAGHAVTKGFPVRDIQVLAPMYRGPAGIDALNRMLQELFNANPHKKKREILWGETIFRVGDKILQKENRPEDGVFNGDIGEIISIIYARENEDKQDLVFASFDGIEVAYTRADLIQLTHAFCCSVHKAQGSEFPIVILPIIKSYYRMLRRNLIYTAITRSKRFLILCGEEDFLRYGVEKSGEMLRQTRLTQWLINGGEDLETTQPTYEEQLFNADPLIGMENLSPYDFQA